MRLKESMERKKKSINVDRDTGSTTKLPYFILDGTNRSKFEKDHEFACQIV